MIRLSKQSGEDKVINQVIETLSNGGLVVFPTDTVYGLLCDATNHQAVNKLIAFKNRPPGKAISVFTDQSMIDELVKISDKQKQIIKEITPGPFTIILPSKHKVDRLLESEKSSLGVRIPKFDLIEKLITKYKKPVTATSANLTNRSPHYSIETFLKELSEKQKNELDLIVDFSQLPRNKPSTVIDLTESKIKVLREGDASINSKKFYSKSPEETKDIAKKIFEEAKKFDNKKPLVFIIKGEMGVGKTVFVKGIGEINGINNIISPTYVIYYEYGNFYHFDLYQIEESQEFNDLKIDSLLKQGNILCFEWGEKTEEIIEVLKKKSNIIYIEMSYVSEDERNIIVKY